MTETPRPPSTAAFGFVVPGGATHVYPRSGDMEVKKFSVGQFDNNVYVIRDTSRNEALVVDASVGSERVLPELEGARPVGIVITHGHPDHTQQLESLREGLGRPPVYAHPSGIPGADAALWDGESIRVGEIEVRVIHTPGHTPNSLCLLAVGHLFSGDTLFPGGPGHTGGDPTRFEQVMASLARLFELPDDTVVSPGHGLDTTIGRERPHVETWRARGW